MEERIKSFFEQYFLTDAYTLTEKVSQRYAQTIWSHYKDLVHNAIPFQNCFPRIPQFRSEEDVEKFVFFLLDAIVYTEYCGTQFKQQFKPEDPASTIGRLQSGFKTKSTKGLPVSRQEILAHVISEFLRNDFRNILNQMHAVSLLAYVLRVWADVTDKTPLYWGLLMLGHYYDYSSMGRWIHIDLLRLWHMIRHAVEYYRGNETEDISDLYGMHVIRVIDQRFGSPSTDHSSLFEQNVLTTLDNVLFPLQTNENMDEAVALEWQSITTMIMREVFFSPEGTSSNMDDPVNQAKSYFETVVKTLNAMGFQMSNSRSLMESEDSDSGSATVYQRKTRRDEEEEEDKDMMGSKYRRIAPPPKEFYS